ncbi:MAG: aminotransferase class I/II-fold pyridoxal phosphate-dependent enzyme [Acidobacteria bacterium]|nr:aminotransferase class I/II-fold pyridoxal phosphate-dependent enzyme [Acidobacteriota bacterium]
MAWPIRPSLIQHERDTYLTRPRADYVSANEPAPPSDEDTPPHPEPIDCNLGYSQWGVSPLAVAALRDLDLDIVARYPERHHDTLLKPAVLERFGARGLTPHHLFFGHGSFNIIERVITKFLRPTRMIGLGPQFAELPSEFKAAGGCYHPIPLQRPGYTLPLEELEAAIARQPTSVVYIDNPNNPTGQSFPLDDMERLARQCEEQDSVLLVDEALADFVDDAESSIHLVPRYPNVIVARSFSKALGLAAERVGYMFMSGPLAPIYRQVDVPFEPGVLAATLACHTLRDTDYLEHVRAEVRHAKAEVIPVLQDAGFAVLPTHECTSILTVHDRSRNVFKEFGARGILLQAGSSFAGTHEEWDDSYCRLRLVNREALPGLCERIRAFR